MVRITRIVDCTTAAAKQLANRDEIPQHPGLVDHLNEDSLQHLVDLRFDERIGSDRQERASQWLKARHIEHCVEQGLTL